MVFQPRNHSLSSPIDEELEGGKFFIEVKYNGKDLFSRNWELCTLDEDYGDERIIYCPFEPGDYSFVKDRPIPFYLPKVCYVFDELNIVSTVIQ